MISASFPSPFSQLFNNVNLQGNPHKAVIPKYSQDRTRVVIRCWHPRRQGRPHGWTPHTHKMPHCMKPAPQDQNLPVCQEGMWGSLNRFFHTAKSSSSCSGGPNPRRVTAVAPAADQDDSNLAPTRRRSYNFPPAGHLGRGLLIGLCQPCLFHNSSLIKRMAEEEEGRSKGSESVSTFEWN